MHTKECASHCMGCSSSTKGSQAPLRSLWTAARCALCCHPHQAQRQPVAAASGGLVAGCGMPCGRACRHGSSASGSAAAA
ncbi:hypothetical protein OEZ86_003865 [Tetradesmus obliquus]|nr:hypothetical protein OEZ86_003865 [Tetradesmus obliquus]